MRRLERMIQHILTHDSVWIAQMGAIVDDFRKREASESRLIDMCL
jgi:hypothetical protein